MDRLYIKSKWTPPPQADFLEEWIDKFMGVMDLNYQMLQKNSNKSSNLAIVQKSHLDLLRSNRDFVILISDKNLGPAIVEREVYMKNSLQEQRLN